MPCWHYPFYQLTNGRFKVPIGEILELLPEAFDPQATRNFRVKNYQSFELGLDHLNDDDDYIQKSLRTDITTMFQFLIYCFGIILYNIVWPIIWEYRVYII